MFIAYKVFPLDSGDALYNYGLIKGLSEQAEVHVYAVSETDLSNEYDIDVLENIKFHFFSNASQISLFSKIKQKLGVDGSSLNPDMSVEIVQALSKEQYEFVFISHIIMSQYSKLVRDKFPNAKQIYVSHNVEAVNFRLRYKFQKLTSHNKNICALPLNLKKVDYFFRLWKYEYWESYLLKKSYCVFTISKFDAIVHKEMYGNYKSEVFCKPLIEFKPIKSEKELNSFKKQLLIVGSMSWFPNVEGSCWFVNTVMPTLIENGYKLWLVGNSPTDEIKKLQKKYPDNIFVTGRVESTESYFKDCDISIIPLFSGTGAKIKVLESIARRIPTVATSFSAKDYNINNEILIANNSHEFLDQIYKLENDINLRRQLYKNMRNYYSNYMHLSQEIIDLLNFNKD